MRLLELLSPVDRRVMAQLWGASGHTAAALAAVMTDPQRVQAQWQRLTDQERAALIRLLQEDDGASRCPLEEVENRDAMIECGR